MSSLSWSSTSLCRPRATAPLRCTGRRRWLSKGSTQLGGPSFEHIGVAPPVVAALRDAFPNVQLPTPTQAEFIPAILTGKDVLLKDVTGSGKSFGLLLALLSKPRRYLKENLVSRSKKPTISSLWITPHRDLGHQFMYWTCSLHATGQLSREDMPSIMQVMTRGASTPILDQLRAIEEQPPHILVATPQALHEALKVEEVPLVLSELATVVVDEADYVLEAMPPPKKDKYALLKFLRMAKNHPTPTRQILDLIYRIIRVEEYRANRMQAAQEKAYAPNFLNTTKRGLLKTHMPRMRPQLIISSATLKADFRHSLYADGKWLTHDEGELVKVIKHQKKEDHATSSFPSESIVHSALVCGWDGSIMNISVAVDPPSITANTSSPNATSAASATGNSKSDASPPSSLETEEPAEKSTAPEEEPDSVDEAEPNAAKDLEAAFHKTSLEAIATVFALEVPRVALLVLHATESVVKTVEELRELGVNAHGLDVIKGERGGSFLLRKGTSPEETPTLLVGTLATIRGLDLPDLTHVFILRVADVLDLDAYTHAAGRVGRFGKSGKVITVLRRPYYIRTQKKGKATFINESMRLRDIYKWMHVTPVKVEHFGTLPPSKRKPKKKQEGDPATPALTGKDLREVWDRDPEDAPPRLALTEEDWQLATDPKGKGDEDETSDGTFGLRL